MTQEQIDQLNDEALEELHKRALQQAEREAPNGSKTYKQPHPTADENPLGEGAVAQSFRR